MEPIYKEGDRVEIPMRKIKGIVTTVYEQEGREALNIRDEEGTTWAFWANEVVKRNLS